MPLPLPNLDTRRFDDLVAEMRALIPRHAPEWTNHNTSDPGITLVELLAWIAEATLYRVNRVPHETGSFLLRVEDLKDPASLAARLQGAADALSRYLLERLPPEARKLVDGHDRSRPPAARLVEELAGALNRVLADPTFYDRALFEGIRLSPKTLTALAQRPEGQDLIRLHRWLLEDAYPQEIGRARNSTFRNFLALLVGGEPDPTASLEPVRAETLRQFNEPYRAVTVADFERETRTAGAEVERVEVLPNAAEGWVTVIVVPRWDAVASSPVEITDTRLAEIGAHLQDRALVGTRIFVRTARYTDVALTIKVVFSPNSDRAAARVAIEAAIRSYLDPRTGGADGRGWPFRRPVSVFDLDALVEDVAGVDHVRQIVLDGDPAKREAPMVDLPSVRAVVIAQEGTI